MQFVVPVATLTLGTGLAKHAGKFGDKIVTDDLWAPRQYMVPKYDMYFDNFKFHVNWWFVPDLTLSLLFLMLFFQMYLVNYSKLIFELGVVYIIRAIACRLTVGYVSLRRAMTFGQIKGGGNCYYSDLVVSGHTLTACIFYFNILDIYDNNIFLIVYTLIWAISVGSNLFVGDHYSSDVFLGIIISFLLHY